jgi:hypothetical protein
LRPDINWDYLRTRKLFLASPLYGNSLLYGYHTSVLQLALSCQKSGISLGVKYVGCDSLVPRARNRLVSFFLRDPHTTDLLFVDSDISFTVEDVFSLLASTPPIVGGVYPRKQLDWHRIAHAARQGVAPNDLPAYGFVPVLNWKQGGDFPLDSLIEVKHLGTGFLRIQREVFQAMIAQLGDQIAYDYSTDENVFPGEVGYDFFPTGPDTRYPIKSGGRQYLSEDWAFCELARQCGFTLYAAPWVQLTHSGYADYHGSLAVLDAAFDQEVIS